MFFCVVCRHLSNAAILQLEIIPNYVFRHKDKELSPDSAITYSFVAVWSTQEDVRNREIPLNKTVVVFEKYKTLRQRFVRGILCKQIHTTLKFCFRAGD